MRKILNPYNKLEGHKCFACSDKNKFGLNMTFEEHGDILISHWHPKEEFQGFHNVLHGGIQATLMDEIGAWFVQIKSKTSGVTASMNVKYINIVPVNMGALKLKASLIAKRKNLVDVKVELFNPEDKLCTEAEITYFTLPESTAKRRLNFPDYKEFFEEEN